MKAGARPRRGAQPTGEVSARERILATASELFYREGIGCKFGVLSVVTLNRRRIDVDRTGNLPPMPGDYPDHAAPIVCNAAEGRALIFARWGMPTSPSSWKARNPIPASPMSATPHRRTGWGSRVRAPGGSGSSSGASPNTATRPSTGKT